jgi:hypothetical protein
MLFDPKYKKCKSFGMIASIIVFLIVQLFSFTMFTAPVHASGFPVVDAVAAGQRTSDGVLDYIGKVLYATGIGGLITGVSYLARKVAFDTATYIGSAGKGQKPLIFTNNWDEYLSKEVGNAAATAIDQFGAPFGLNLCQFPDIRLQAQVQVGLRNLYDSKDVKNGGGPQPSCTWQQMSDSWSNADIAKEIGEGSLNAFSDTLKVSQTDFGITLGALGKIDRLQGQMQQAKLFERLEGNGYKAVKGLVSDKVKTPAAIVEEETKALTAKHQGEITYGQISGIYGSGALEILPMAGSVFLNTLINQFLSTLLTDGLVPEKDGSSNGGGVANFFADSIVNSKRSVEQAFSYLFTAVPKKQVGSYDLITKFLACPHGVAELNNCVIDEKFKLALQQASVGDALTIQEAVDKKFLRGNWPLISPLRIADNTDLNCRDRGYCYSNIQKLRKVRVLPLGFEIAALKSDPDKPITLQEVLSKYNDCDFTDDSKTKVKYNRGKPFCRLIDPNWVIRLPEARCETLSVGPQLVSPNSPDRREECADISTCITEGPNGECIDEEYYGYCTKEKNSWYIGQTSCPAEFNTCKTFVDGIGIAKSYLSRTIDYGSCNQASVGCSTYSVEEKNVGLETASWVNSGEADLNIKKQGRSQVMYFNSNIANFSCPADAAGCNAFYGAVKVGDTYTKPAGKPDVYIKKSPDYLGCYDIDPAVPGVQWPKTKTDLAKLPTSAACKQYAQVCLEEETACQSYTDIVSGDEIPGIIGDDFQCEAECVGYDAYKQEGEAFDAEKYPMYFIPQNGVKNMAENGLTCSAVDAGCSEFTNLESETLEYYTDLKYCEKPDATGSNQKTYYSWEGDQTSGFVLRVHKLLQIDNEEFAYIKDNAKPNLGAESASDVFHVGSPAYAEDSKKSLEEQYADCNETNYTNLINNSGFSKADLDCRALYDDTGKVFYRLLANTVTVSNACQSLRITTPEFEVDANIASEKACTNKAGVWNAGQCQRCKGGGEYQNGACIYAGIAGESNACTTPSANQCRKYVGSAGNNVANLVDDDFDGTAIGAGLKEDVEGYNATGGKKKATIVAESVQVGLRSLQVEATTLTRDLPADAVQQIKGDLYEVSFWARGTSLKLEVSIQGDGASYVLTEDAKTGNKTAASIGDTWKHYQFGPVRIDKDITNPKLVFKETSKVPTPTYFLDSVKLSRVSDTHYLIKDSWKVPGLNGELVDVPLSCDATPADPFPGARLGCRAYSFSDSDGDSITAFATGFEKLCRQGAIGCSALYDTYNTVDIADAEKSHIFNLECSDRNTPATKEEICTLSIGETELDEGRCKIRVGEISCLVPHVVIGLASGVDSIKNGKIVPSTIITKEDSKDPVFLTNNSDSACSAIHQGCQKVALQEEQVTSAGVEYNFQSEAFVRNNPDTYADTQNGVLCSENSVGCGEFRANNATTYFKDPRLTGNRLCDYRTRVEKNGNQIDGWFKSSVDGDVPCYAGFVEQGGDYGIWSNKSGNYDGFVGSCDIQHNECTELIDPADKTADYPGGKPYYVIFNDNLKKDISKCSGEVSQKEGCVLFDRTENPKKQFSSTLTYKESERRRFEGVPPVAGTAGSPSDANIILKVDRNRECSEWLACKTSIVKIDENNNPQRLCYDFAACREQKNGECADWAEVDFGNEFVDEEIYVQRDGSWYGEEYTGYSMHNKYQATYYDYISVSNTSYIVYKQSDEYFPDLETEKAIGCKTAQAAKPDWVACGISRSGLTLGGRCFAGECVYPIEGNFPKTVGVKTVKSATDLLGRANSCKAFPEKNSPFPQSVLKTAPLDDKDIISPSSKVLKTDAAFGKKRIDVFNREIGFQNANVCQDGEDCSCSYVKAEYRGAPGIDYWVSELDVVPGICIGGDNAGASCNKDDHCDSKACGKKIREEEHIGLRGYCLEYDLSRRVGGFDDSNGSSDFACLTWLPIDVNPSGLDQYNNYQDAGYYPAVDAVTTFEDGQSAEAGKAYCTDSNAHGRRTYDPNMMGIFSYGKGSFLALGDFGGDGTALKQSFAVAPADGDSYGKHYGPDVYNIKKQLSEEFHNAFYGGCDALADGARQGNTCQGSYNVRWAQVPLQKKPEKKNDKYSPQMNTGYYDVNKDFQKMLYTNMQLFAWKGTGMDEKPNTIVWYIDNPSHMTKYFEGTYNSIKKIDNSGVDDEKNYYNHFHGKTSTVAANPYKATGAGNELTDSEISKVTLTPFMVPSSCGDATDDGDKKTCNYFKHTPEFGNAVNIDFNRIRDIKPDGDGLKVFAENLTYDYYYPGTLSSAKYNATIGKLNTRDYTAGNNGWYGQFQYGYPLSKKVYRYGLLMTVPKKNTSESIPKEAEVYKVIKDLAKSGATTAQFHYLHVYIDFDKETGKHITKLPLKVHGKVPMSGRSSHFATLMKDGTPAVGAIVELNGRCTEVQGVYSKKVQKDSPSESRDKAWTNRLWDKAKNIPRATVQKGSFANFLVGVFDKESPLKPFSSLLVSYLDLNKSNEFLNISAFVINNVDTDGMPFSCTKPLLGTTGFKTGDLLPKDFCTALIRYKGDKSIIESTKNKAKVAALLNPGQGQELLERLFAKTFVVQKDINGKYKKQKGWDVAATIAPKLTVPQIFSLNPYRCFKNADLPCTPGEKNNITVNQRNGTLVDYDGEFGPDEDPYFNGSSEALIAKQSMSAVVKFFAFADDNRMPIKRVMVDWGDGDITNANTYGRYKNQKPFCDEDDGFKSDDVGYCGTPGKDTLPTLLTCKENSDCPFPAQGEQQLVCRKAADLPADDKVADDFDSFQDPRFGNSPRACNEGYFKYVHSYTCPKNSRIKISDAQDILISPKMKVLLGEAGLSLEDSVCVYKPKVQVMDNWGWCNGNGQCLDVKGNKVEGCFTGKISGKSVNQCNHDKAEPWTEYQGSIIIIPKSKNVVIDQ